MVKYEVENSEIELLEAERDFLATREQAEEINALKRTVDAYKRYQDFYSIWKYNEAKERLDFLTGNHECGFDSSDARVLI